MARDSVADASDAEGRQSPAELFGELDPASAQYAVQFVDRLLAAACRVGASDIHLQPVAAGLEIRWRIDGVLETLGVFPAGGETNVIARLKVLAHLLTYRNDVPQEGRIADPTHAVEMRISTFPTLHGERGVVRLFAAEGQFRRLNDLGLPSEIAQQLPKLLAETSGAILVCGPAGSGKTTTAYACLREIAKRSAGGRSIVTLEDPIETEISGVAQSEINSGAGFDFAAGLRSLMRQDPEVILVGEIRDPTTAATAFQAALTGQLVLSTFHSGSAAGAIGRLADMGIEPYVLRSGVLAIICQRLVRRLCTCKQPIVDNAELLGLRASRGFIAGGCSECGGSGYRGRAVIAELFSAVDKTELARAILSKSDAADLERLAVAGGMATRWDRAIAAVEAGTTSPAEIRRVLGFGHGTLSE